MHDHFYEVMKGLWELHTLGDPDSPGAEEVRCRLDPHWRHLSEDERDLVRAFSEELLVLSGKTD